MGAGKSAVGRRLSRLLKRDFFDSDAEIEKRTGVDIPFIFEKEGEPGFREREKKMIEELSEAADAVIATGGGAILDPDNRECMAKTGFVVYLHATIEQQLARTKRTQHRPLLQVDDRESRIKSLDAERGPLYEGMADLTVQTDGRRVYAVARDVMSELDAKHGGSTDD